MYWHVEYEYVARSSRVRVRVRVLGTGVRVWVGVQSPSTQVRVRVQKFVLENEYVLEYYKSGTCTLLALQLRRNSRPFKIDKSRTLYPMSVLLVWKKCMCERLLEVPLLIRYHHTVVQQIWMMLFFLYQKEERKKNKSVRCSLSGISCFRVGVSYR